MKAATVLTTASPDTWITGAQLDIIAMRFRGRGATAAQARREWAGLSEQDRDWWRDDTAAALRAAGLVVTW